MKIHEYNQMMAYLTRPAVPGPRIADREPYYMGGRVGFAEGTTSQVKNFLNNLKKGSTVNRTNLIQKFNVDPSSLTKILKEYEDKNFTFEKSPSALKGSILNKPTKAQAELSEFLYGKKWNELSGQERSNIVNQGYNKDTVTEYRRNKLNTQYNKITKDLGYDKPYSELGYEDQRRVRRGDPPGVKFAGAKRQIEMVNKDLRLLAENSDIQEIFKKGVTGKKDLALVRDILGQNANAPMRLTQLASAFTGDRPVEGITPRFKEQAAKIIEDTPYSTYQRDLDELKIGKSVGEKSTASIKRDIRKIPDYNIGGAYNIDEPAGVTSSVRAGTRPYGIFGQIIDRDINAGDKYRFDRQKLTRELELQKAIASGEGVDTQVKKFNQLVNDAEEYLNQNRKFGQKKIKLFKVSLEGPEKTIERFNALPKSYQDAFKNNFKNKGYSFKVPADYKTIPEIKEIVQNPSRLKTLLKTAATKAPRILAIPAALGLGIYSLSSTGLEAAEMEAVKAGSMFPEAAAGAGAVGLAYKYRKPIMRGIGKLAAIGAVPLELGFMGSEAEQGKSMSEVLASPFMLQGAARENRIRKIMGDDAYVKRQEYYQSEADPVFYGEGEATGQELDLNLKILRDMAEAKVQDEDDARKEEARQFNLKSDETMFNEGGRVGYAKGPKDPSKRLFLKGVGALTMLPILGKYFKLAEPATKAAVQYTGPVIEKIKGLEWVQFLAKRLWTEGDDVTKTAATMDGQVVRRGTLESGDEVDMIYDTRSGDVSFEVSGKDMQTTSGAYNDPYALDYKAAEVIEETGKKTKPKIEVGEATPRQVGPEDVELEGEMFDVDGAVSDLTELEAFAKKKLTKEIHKTKGTKPKDVSPEYDGPEPDLDYDVD